MKWKNKGHEFDELANRIINDENKYRYYIWGCAGYGISFLNSFHEEIEIVGFIDSDEKKWNSEVEGQKVYPPSILCNMGSDIIVLVATGWTAEVFGKLDDLGFKKNVNYFHVDEFISIYMYYKKNKVCISDMAYIITDKCSLKCKKCVQFMPLLAHGAKDVPIEQIMDDLEAFFRWVDYCNIFMISGGDAMLHSDFVELIQKIGDKYYPNSIGSIEVLSNAVKIPTPQELDIMKKYSVFYRFTDYRPYTDKIQKVEEVVQLLNENKILCDYVKFDTWYDCGYPQDSNGIVGDEELVKFFSACDMRKCHGLFGKKATFCVRAHFADRINYCMASDDDYFDISKYHESRRMEFIEFMLGYSDKGYLNYCKKCNGGLNVNPNKIPAGEQL